MGATQLLARHVLENSSYDLLPDRVVAIAKAYPDLPETTPGPESPPDG